MFLNLSREKLNQAGVFVFLLTQSVMLHAEAGAPDSASERQANADSSQWPARMQINKEQIPPPPPGPYSSSALRNKAVRGSVQDLHNRPQGGFNTSGVPMDTFNPSIPWPDELTHDRRVQQGANNYAQQPAAQNRNQMRPYRQSNNSNGYWPGMNDMGQQRMPSMNFSPDRYNNYGYQNQPYRHNSSAYRHPAYQNPANNFYQQPVNPVNRSQNPASNNQGYQN